VLSKQVMDLTPAAIVQFQNWLSQNGNPETTRRAYGSDLRMLLEETGSNISAESLEEVASYWLNRSKRKFAPKTTVRRITSVRAFARWAGIGEILRTYVAPKPGRSVPRPLPERMDGVTRMCDAATRPEYAALVAFGGFVGLRVSESLGIECAHIDTRDLLLTVRGKGDVTRVIPLSVDAWTYLAPCYVAALGTDEHRLIPYGNRFARQTITSLGERAGLSRRVASHDLRATFATCILEKTGNIRLVQELLGHASLLTTQAYTEIKIDQMRLAVNTL
jgi:integrase/recombinase XerC